MLGASSAGGPRGRCLPPEQRVLTADGYRPASAVDVRDRVVTGLGRIRLVTAIDIWQVDEPLYHLRTERGHVLRVTGGHPVLSRRGDGLPEWVAAAALRPADTVAVVGSSALPWRVVARPPVGPEGGVALLREELSVYTALDWVPVVAVDATPYVGPVYDLDVEEDHSLISEGVVLAACRRR